MLLRHAIVSTLGFLLHHCIQVSDKTPVGFLLALKTPAQRSSGCCHPPTPQKAWQGYLGQMKLENTRAEMTQQGVPLRSFIFQVPPHAMFGRVASFSSGDPFPLARFASRPPRDPSSGVTARMVSSCLTTRPCGTSGSRLDMELDAAKGADAHTINHEQLREAKEEYKKQPGGALLSIRPLWETVDDCFVVTHPQTLVVSYLNFERPRGHNLEQTASYPQDRYHVVGGNQTLPSLRGRNSEPRSPYSYVPLQTSRQKEAGTGVKSTRHEEIQALTTGDAHRWTSAIHVGVTSTIHFEVHLDI